MISLLICAKLLSPVALNAPTALTVQGGKLETYEEKLPDSVVKIKMIAMEGGKIKIGDKEADVKPYYIAETETTWEAFDQFLRSGPPSPPYDQTKFAPDAIARPSKGYILPDLGWGHNGYPVINAAITNVEMFCKWLSKTTGKKYRMPTEAEWELAARGGVTGDFKLSKADLDKVAWYAGNSDEGTTHPVMKKAPNKFGLYDIIGNTGEWAMDFNGKPCVCGITFEESETADPLMRRYYDIKWQEEDPQLPKSRWWMSNAPFAGLRLVCEP